MWDTSDMQEIDINFPWFQNSLNQILKADIIIQTIKMLAILFSYAQWYKKIFIFCSRCFMCISMDDDIPFSMISSDVLVDLLESETKVMLDLISIF